MKEFMYMIIAFAVACGAWVAGLMAGFAGM